MSFRRGAEKRIVSLATLLVAGLLIAVSPVVASDVGPGVPAPAPVWQQIFARPADAWPSASITAVDRARTELGRKTELGRWLFGDTRLSGDGERSCATCHQPRLGFTDGRVRPLGRDGRLIRRNTQALYDLRWGRRFYWDGRAVSLADQARFPILDPNEMAGNFPAIVARLANDPIMRDAFSSAFHDGEISSGSIREALAAYVSSIVSPVTRFDRWVAGDRQAMTQAEYNGFRLFAGKAGCVACHAGWRFTDDRFHDIGLASPDLGRGGLDEVARRRSRDPQAREIAPGEPAFRTPGLRQLARTAPYMHDGSKATLDDVMAHYAGGLRRRQSLSPPLKRPIDLTHEERDLIVAFLLSLSSD